MGIVMATNVNTVVPADHTAGAKEASFNSVILKETFLSFPKAKEKYEVTLTLEGITFATTPSKNGEVRKTVLPTRDITGCQVMRGKSAQDSCAYICVFSYPMRKKKLSSKVVRRRETEMFTVKKFENYEENVNVAQLWAAAIRDTAHGIIYTSTVSFVPARKPMLVLLNPCSGPGKALQLFQERVVPMLSEACISYHLIVTDHASHATEICQSMDISKWYGIVIMSGDGLIYEAINGLMLRQDWEEAIKTPIGCLPGGSGNALCCSLNDYAGEPVKENPILHSTFLLLKHQIKPMDIVAIDSLAGRCYSFLSVMWGFLADVDIESERYRYLGDARFTVGALARIFNLRTYRGKISFLPKKPYEHHRPNGMVRSRSTTDSTCTEQLRPPRRSESMISPGLMTAESSTLANGLDIHRDDNGAAKFQVDNIIAEDEEKPKNLQTVTASSEQPSDQVLTVNGNSTNSNHKKHKKHKLAPVPTTLLPPLNKPVPSNWVTIEDEFIAVAITTQSYITRDVYITPSARLDDGVIHMTLVRAGLSKMRLIDIMGAMETGKHMDSEDIENIEVLAFRIEPITPGGTLMVDGENVPYGPIQAQVLPSMARVMGLSKK